MPAGGLARTSTRVGKAKKGAYRRRGGYMRKTTKKGAYNKNRKNQMMIRRAPMVETKTKTTEANTVMFGTHPRIGFEAYNTPHAHINPDVLHFWTQGLAEQQIIGKSVFVKYLKRKITIRFPQPNVTNSLGVPGVIPKIPQRYELVWGFIPAPLHLSNSTTPTDDANTIAHTNDYINQRVKDYFDQRSDRLRYIPKAASNIKIVGRRKVRPDLRYLSTAPPATMDPSFSSTYATGSIPDYNTSIQWPMMKKLHLEFSDNLHGGVAGLYPNYQYLAFCVFVAHDWNEIPVAERPAQMCQIAFNDCVWFTDS